MRIEDKENPRDNDWNEGGKRLFVRSLLRMTRAHLAGADTARAQTT